MSMCDSCVNFEYDENDEEYYCSASMDEDDYVRFITSPEKICPFYRLEDEYAVVGIKCNAEHQQSRQESAQMIY